MGAIDNICLVSGCSREEVRKEILQIFISLLIPIFITIFVIIVSARFPKFKVLFAIVPLSFLSVFISLSKCRCLSEYFKVTSALGKEELYACVAILVLSLLGSWNYIIRALWNSFPATARVLRCKANVGSKLFKEVKDIVENVVFKDGTLPHVARERILHTLRTSVEDYGMLVQVLVTGLSMIYMFFIIVAFLSFISSMFNPSGFVFMVILMTLMFSFVIMSKSPVHDYAIPELKEKIKIIIPISLLAMILSIAITKDISIGFMIFLLTFFAVGLMVLKNSRRIDKIDNAVVWDRVINLRLIKGVPVDQALVSILGRSVYEVYIKTYPFNAIRNLLLHLEDIGGLGVVRMFREMIVEIFNAIQKVVKSVRVNVIMLAGFALAMVGMQVWFAELMLPSLKMMRSFGGAAAGGYSVSLPSMPIQISPSMIIQSLNITATYVPPIIVLAVFLIMRGCSSSTQAMKIALGLGIVMFLVQVFVKFLLVPHLEVLYVH